MMPYYQDNGTDLRVIRRRTIPPGAEGWEGETLGDIIIRLEVAVAAQGLPPSAPPKAVAARAHRHGFRVIDGGRRPEG